MKLPIFNTLNKRIALDLGTSVTRIGVVGKSSIFQEPTCIAFDANTREVLAVGKEAAAMVGKTSEKTELAWPIREAEIYDDLVLTALLKLFFEKAVGSTILLSPTIMATVPAGATQATQEITTGVLHNLGASEAHVIAQPLAASIGAGVPIADASGSFFCHLGSGQIESVVVSLGSIIAQSSSTKAGLHYAAALATHLRKTLQLTVSMQTLEKIMQNIASLDTKSLRQELVGGQDVLTKSPKEVLLTSAHVYEPTLAFGQRCVQLVSAVLSQMPTQLTVDSIDKGLLLSGGLAQLHGLEGFLTQNLGISASVVENPELVAIKGTLNALQHIDEFKKSIAYSALQP